MLERGEALPREGLFADDLQQLPLPAQAYTTLLAGEACHPIWCSTICAEYQGSTTRSMYRHSFEDPSRLAADLCLQCCGSAGVEKVLPLVPEARRAQLLGGFAALWGRTPSKSPVKLACLRFMAGLFARPARFLRPGADGEVLVPEAEAAQWLQVRLCAMTHST